MKEDHDMTSLSDCDLPEVREYEEWAVAYGREDNHLDLRFGQTLEYADAALAALYADREKWKWVARWVAEDACRCCSPDEKLARAIFAYSNLAG
jgi:hypothetical protein